MDPWRRLAETLLGPATLTGRDVARQSGLELGELRRLWQSLGFAPVPDDDLRFTPTDVDAARAVLGLVETQRSEPEDVLHLAHVLGHALAAIGDAQIGIVRARIEARRRDDPDMTTSDTELTARLEALAPTLEGVLGYVWRRQLVAAALRSAAVPAHGEHLRVVGFADMVGFTPLSQTLDDAELTRVLRRFETVAHEHIVRHGGREVKMIGDEVMFCVDEPERAADIALDLIDAHAQDPNLPPIRVGASLGPTLAWDGDYFGPTVNLANRLVNVAWPGTALVCETLGERLGEAPGLELRRLPTTRLKGIGKQRPFVVRRGARV